MTTYRTAGTDPSQLSMPVGDLPGWTYRAGEDFLNPFAKGAWVNPTGTPPNSNAPAPYTNKLVAYRDGCPDTSGSGQYDTRVVSVQNSCLDIHVGYFNGKPTGAMFVFDPTATGSYYSQTYGRFAMQWKADPVPGYGAVGLLWPADNTWVEGELDWPEGPLTGTAHANAHVIGNPRVNAISVDSGIPMADSIWHEAVIEWVTAEVRFYADGVLIARSTQSPTHPFRWTFQVGTAGSIPAATARGHVLIDWIATWDWNGAT